jgi:hypothetical protein
MGRALRRAFWVVAAALGVAIAVPFLVPVSHFIPELSRYVSDKLGQPMAIEALRLHLIPSPRVVAHRVTAGRRGQVTIGELEIVPDLGALVGGARSIRLIRAQRVVIEEGALAIPHARAKPSPGGAQLEVRRVLLNAVKLKHPIVDMPLFDADVRLAKGLRLREARFETHDGKLKLRVVPAGPDALAVELAATSWTLLAGSPLEFDALAAHGTLKGGELELAKLEGALYGGKISGSAHIAWGKHWQAAGRVALAGVELAPLQKALGKPAHLSGRLHADANFSTQAKTAAELREQLSLQAPFEVLGGVYRGVDLARASQLGDERDPGDATYFEELKGRLELSGQRVRLQPLCMRSPSLVAAGKVEIAPDKSVNGKLDISVAQTGGILGVPVTLGGTTDEVTMRPSKGYLIGAAIGTAIMPGLGTSIGSAIGGRIGVGLDCK